MTPAEIAEVRKGAHVTHCCKRHGCKYGDEDCPVVLGTAQQECACEDDRRGSRCFPTPKSARAHNLSFAPATWETMQTRAAERGFASVSAYLTHLVNEDTKGPPRVAPGRGVVKVKR